LYDRSSSSNLLAEESAMLPRYHPKRVLSGLAYRLNKGAQDAVFNLTCAYLGKWKVLSRLAPECGVKTFVVNGAYGEIRGMSSDTAILPEYVEKGVWAAEFNRLLAEFYGDGGGTYLDIGANIGLTTIPLARNPRIQCIAMEPEPATYANLVANVRTNCPNGNVTAKQIAVFDKRSTLDFELATLNSGDHRIRMSNSKGRQEESLRKTISVEAAPLDEILADVALSEPLAAKIDTQGAEPFVFAGGRKTLGRAKLIIVEWSPYLMARLGGDPKIVVDFLGEHFESLSIVKFGEEGVSPAPVPSAVAAQRLMAMAVEGKDDPNNYCDVVARR
jgi:FkbM family methyltransferase